MFNKAVGSFDFFGGFQLLLDEDGQFNEYIELSLPVNDYLASIDFCPVFLSDRECIECLRDGTIHRYEFVPSSLKYLMTKKLFRMTPDLRTQITAKKFRALTGVEGVRAHFVEGHVIL